MLLNKFSLVELLINRVFTFYFLKNRNNHPNMVLYNDWIGFNILLNGVYEKNELQALLNNCNPNLKKTTFLDIGANIGNHSVFLSGFFEKVNSFEPQLKTFKILQLNTEIFSNINIFNFGIDYIEREVIFKIPNNNNGSSSEHNDFANYREEKVKLKPISSDLLFNAGYVKIDVEGNELSVLKSLFSNKINFSPLISIELHGNHKQRIEILKLLEKNSYLDVFTLNYPQNRINKLINLFFGVPNKLVIKPIDEIITSKLDYNFLVFQ